MTAQFVDPMNVAPLVLSFDSAQWLVDARELHPSKLGLLGGLTPAASSANVPKELLALGLGPRRMGRPTREQEMLRAGLEIAAQPQRKVTCTISEPGKAVERHQFFVRKGLASLAWFDEQAFYVGPAFPLITLRNAVLNFVRSDLELPATAIPPDTLAVVQSLFPAELTPRLLSALVVQQKFGAAREVERLIEQLVSLKVLTRQGERYGPAAVYQTVLEALRSGQVSFLEHDELGDGAKPSGRQRFVFVGPPRQKLWTFDVEKDGQTLACFQAIDFAKAEDLASPLALS